MNTLYFDDWFNDLKEKEKIEDVKFALGETDNVSVRELKDEFKRLHTMAQVPELTLPVESCRIYEDAALREILSAL